MTMNRRCVNCQALFGEIGAYCPRCGQHISGDRSTNVSTRVHSLPQRANSSSSSTRAVTEWGGGVLIAGFLFLIFLAIVVAFGSNLAMSPRNSAPPPAFPSGPFPFSGIPVPQTSIRDSQGREITDPAMRAAIEAEIQKNQR
jgi:hypothetical protein